MIIIIPVNYFNELIPLGIYTGISVGIVFITSDLPVGFQESAHWIPRELPKNYEYITIVLSYDSQRPAGWFPEAGAAPTLWIEQTNQLIFNWYLIDFNLYTCVKTLV